MSLSNDFFNVHYFFQEVEIAVDADDEPVFIWGEVPRPKHQKKVVKEEVLVLINPNTGQLRYHRIMEPKLKFKVDKPQQAQNIQLKIENLKNSIEFAPISIFRESAKRSTSAPPPEKKQLAQHFLDYMYVKEIIAGGLLGLFLYAVIMYIQRRKEQARKERILKAADFIYDLTEYQFNDTYF